MKPSAPDCGSLVISIDLELAPGPQMRLDDRRRLASITDLLIRVFADFRLAATWAVADLALSAATEAIQAANVDHEVAILGDRSWIGPQAGRTRFARELSRRVLAARAAGLTPSTLVLRDAPLCDHFDLLVKHGVTAVRDTRSMCSQTPWGAEAVRYGVWRIGETHRLDNVAAGRLGSSRTLRRALSRACRRSEACHWVIDAAQLLHAGPRTERRLRRALRFAAQLRDQEVLSVRTMTQTVRQLVPARALSPARSILHPAA